jgi:hypothetical protein
MPIKDGDERRAYFRDYMRRRRAGEPMSAAETKTGQQNLRSVLLMNSAASIKCAAYDGPVDDKIIEACQRAANAWSDLASKLDFEVEDAADSESEIATPAVIEDNILYAIQRINENARVFTKILRASALDREAASRINTAIDGMIRKWRSIQSTLEQKAR